MENGGRKISRQTGEAEYLTFPISGLYGGGMVRRIETGNVSSRGWADDNAATGQSATVTIGSELGAVFVSVVE